MANSILYVAVAQAWRIVFGIITAAALGRLLVPSDFGLVATAAPILAFVTMLQNFGFTQAIIQRKVIDEGQLNGLFWISIVVSSGLAMSLFLISSHYALFFGEQRLGMIIEVSAFLVVLTAIASQPLALLNRHLRFKMIAGLDIFSTTIGATLTVVVAYYTRSYWALLIPQAATPILNLFGASLSSGWRPGRPIFDRGLREMVNFGAGISTFSVLNFLSRNADNLMIAKAYGSTQLGLYDRAYKLMLFPISKATLPFGRVVMPLLSRLQDQPDEYRTTYLNTTSYLMAAMQPAVLCATIYSPAAVLLLLGDGWEGVVPIFTWLGLAGVHQIFTSTLGWLFVSQGRGRDFAILGAFGSTTTIASFAIGLPWGPLGVAVAYTLSDYLIRLPVTWWLAGRKGPVHWRDLCGNSGPHVLGLAVSGCLLLLVSEVATSPNGLELACLVALSYACNLLVLGFFPSKRSLMKLAISEATRFKNAVFSRKYFPMRQIR